MNSSSGAEPPTGNHEIDHVMPQTLNDEWKRYIERHKGNVKDHLKYLNRFGNLTLLTEKMNIVASNDTYEERKKYYKDSGFVLTRELALDDKWKTWSFDVINERQKVLVSRLCAIFS
jgi:hypothetical protein